jgi:hypothetical protein
VKGRRCRSVLIALTLLSLGFSLMPADPTAAQAGGNRSGTPSSSSQPPANRASSTRTGASTLQTAGSEASRAFEVFDMPLSTARIVVLTVVGIGAMLFFVLFIFGVVTGDVPRMESHWGGLGGGLGGWELSASLSFLIAALVLSGLFVLASVLWMTPLQRGGTTSDKGSATQSAAPAKTSSPATEAAPSGGAPAN